MTTRAGGAGGLTRKLLNLDAKLLAALLDVDGANLPWIWLVARVGAGALTRSEGAAG